MHSTRAHSQSSNRNNSQQSESTFNHQNSKINTRIQQTHRHINTLPMNKCVSSGNVNQTIKGKQTFEIPMQHANSTYYLQNVYELGSNNTCQAMNLGNQTKMFSQEPTITRHSQKYSEYLNPAYFSFEPLINEKQTSTPSTTEMLPTIQQRQRQMLNLDFSKREQQNTNKIKSYEDKNIRENENSQQTNKQHNEKSIKIKPTLTPTIQAKANEFQNQNKQVEKKYTKIDSLRSSNFDMEESTVQNGIKFLQQKYRKMSPQKHSPQLQRKDSKKQISHPVFGKFKPEGYQLEIFFVNSNQSIPSPIRGHQQFNQIYNGNIIQEPTGSKNIKYALKNHQQGQRNKNEGQKYPSQKLPRWLQNLKVDEQPYPTGAAFYRVENSEPKYYLNPSPLLIAEPDQSESKSLLYGSMQNSNSLINFQFEMHSNSRSIGRQVSNKDKLSIFDPAQFRRESSSSNNVHASCDLSMQNREGASNKQHNMKSTSMSLSANHMPNQPALQFDNFPSFNGKHRNKQLFTRNNRDTCHEERRKSDMMGDRLRNKQNGRQIQYESNQISVNISDQADRKLSDNNLHHDEAQVNAINQYYTAKDVREKFSRHKEIGIAKAANKKLRRPLSRPKSMTYSVGSNQINNLNFNQIPVNHKQGETNINSAIKPYEDLHIDSCIKKQSKLINQQNKSPTQHQNLKNVYSPRAYKVILQNKEFRIGEGANNNFNIQFNNNNQNNFIYPPLMGQRLLNAMQNQVKNKPMRTASSEARFFYSREQVNSMIPGTFNNNAEHKPIIAGRQQAGRQQTQTQSQGLHLNANMIQLAHNFLGDQGLTSGRVKTESAHSNSHHKGVHLTLSPAPRKRGIQIVDKQSRMSYMITSQQQTNSNKSNTHMRQRLNNQHRNSSQVQYYY